MPTDDYRYFLSRLASMCADAIELAKIECRLDIDSKGVRLSYCEDWEGVVAIVDWPSFDPPLPFNGENEPPNEVFPLDPLVECQVLIKGRCMERWALRTNGMDDFANMIAQLVSGLVFWRLANAKPQKLRYE